MSNVKNLFLLFIAGLFLIIGLALPNLQPAEPVFALTATPSATAVLPPEGSHTLTVTLDCTVTDAWQVHVRGENWFHYEPVVLFVNGRLRHAYGVDHEPDFEQVWTLSESLERPLTIVATTGFRRQSVTLQPCANRDSAFLPYVQRFGVAEPLLTEPDIVLSPDCGEGGQIEMTVTGTNWEPDEDVALFWNGRLHAQVAAPHNGQFQQTWNVPIETFQNPLLTVSPSSGVWRIFARPCSDDPIPTVTPFGGGPTATPCGDNCPAVPTVTPFATTTPCAIGCPVTLTPTPCPDGSCVPTVTPYITLTATPQP